MAREGSVIPRRAEGLIRRALGEARVVMISGPRQSGKTTLAMRFADEMSGTYRTLDDQATLEAAITDPVGLVEAPGLVILDEAQRAGDALILAVKSVVDREDQPGRYLLTGSTNYLTIPTISESLAGRVQIVDLWPLSQGELVGARETFIDRLFNEPTALRGSGSHTDRRNLFGALCRGGFPAIVGLGDEARRRWHRDYVRTVVDREIRDISDIRRGPDIRRLVALLAARTSQELNTSAIARDLGIRWNTVSEYLTLLESAYVWFQVPAWSRNLSAKVIRHPKAHVVDSGLAASTLRATPDALMSGHPATGQLVESFAIGEIARQITWSETEPALGHFRDRDGHEVDAILEAWDGRVAGIEVKAASSVGAADFRSLALVRDRLGAAFAGGVVLYSGHQSLSFGDRLLALPLSSLWSE